ncbi:hypothetical protein KWG22_18155 [Acinetobacter pittii]|uniref:hypothetical protein n=1 Tax=Acinetobacter pittii TaxID=48296 RepID=UPI00355B5256
MRNQITKIGEIAARSANRLYDTNLKPFINEMKQQEAKEVFASTVMIRAAAELFHLLGPEFEGHLDMLVEVMKNEANAQNECKKSP